NSLFQASEGAVQGVSGQHNISVSPELAVDDGSRHRQGRTRLGKEDRFTIVYVPYLSCFFFGAQEVGRLEDIIRPAYPLPPVLAFGFGTEVVGVFFDLPGVRVQLIHFVSEQFTESWWLFLS